MRQFIAFVYFEGRIYGFTADGDCWEFNPRSIPTYTLVCRGPIDEPFRLEPSASAR